MVPLKNNNNATLGWEKKNVTNDEHLKTMLHCMHAKIKAKSGPTKDLSV